MTYNEGVIRDFLAEDLSLLEAGLELIGTEYHLRNNFGSKGFIDILARDKHGLIVIIELKRSNAAARQCIHELFKYAGLLAKNDGLRLDQLRCIAVSTEWHELLLPYSELYHAGNFQLSGYKLSVDNTGKPISAEFVQPLPAQSGVELCPEHTIFLYKDNQRRFDDLERLTANFSKLGLADYVMVELNHVKRDRKVIFPFGVLVALPLMTYYDHDTLHPRVQNEFDEDCRYPIEMAISVAIQEGLDFDDIEISYPDKFLDLVSDRTWRVGRWYNSGKLKITPLRSSELILAEIAAFDSGVGTSFFKTLSPKNHLAWTRFLENVRLHVNWCDGWKQDLFAFLDDVSGRRTSVSVRIYAPDDMLNVLHKAFIEGDPSCLPYMEVIASNEYEITDVLIGYIGWTGRPVEASLDAFIKDTYEAFEGYVFMRHHGEQGEFEGATCAFFGVNYATARLENLQASEVAAIDGKAYEQSNGRVLRELREIFEMIPVLAM